MQEIHENPAVRALFEEAGYEVDEQLGKRLMNGRPLDVVNLDRAVRYLDSGYMLSSCGTLQSGAPEFDRLGAERGLRAEALKQLLYVAKRTAELEAEGQA